MSSKMVKIVQFHQTGGPEVLQLEEMLLPEPGMGEVRLRVQAIGLNRAEVMYRKGAYFTKPHFPAKNGYEAAGIVEAIGSDVDPNLLRKKVSTIPCFDLNSYGVYGEVAIVPVYALAPYPENLTPIEATSIWMQYITAYGALIHLAKMTQGDFVIITAASSSVGIAAIEMAKAEGAISIATTRTSAKKSQLLASGADHVIVTDEEDVVERVKTITAGKGARIIFDPIVGHGLEALAEVAAPQGIIFTYGNLAQESAPYPLFAAMEKGLTFRGYTLFEIVSQPEIREKAEKYVMENLISGMLKPKIDKIFSLDQIVEAHRYMESNEQIGKIVVRVD